MSKKYTKEDVGKHNKEGDCWIIIEDKVYDVSGYTEHPGGFDLLLDESGVNKDATEAYEDAEHTKTARKKLKEFLIGEVGTSAPVVPAESKQDKKEIAPVAVDNKPMPTLFQKEQSVCYGILFALTAIGCVTDKIPIQVNITLHSILIIAIGAYKSIDELLSQMKKVHLLKIKGAGNIEQMSMSDAMQFPIFAGFTLCGLYYGMQYFGKDSVNYFIIFYIGVGGTTGIKALIQSFMPGAFDAYDKDYIIDFNIKMIGLELQITLFDVLCFIISMIQMACYIYFKSFVFNNILCLIFCIHALQTMFLGNFKNGFMLLTLLFFYDIFFVFGTDVMLTVAKGIDAPIKLQFPKDYSGEKPKYSILGLGDIVIPGVFVSLCLRFDFLKSINIDKFQSMLKKEAEGEDVDTMKYLVNQAANCKKTYFKAVNVGYLLAMICTIVVMLVFEHGQPALLYLVPGCMFSVLGASFFMGEFQELWDFDEEAYIAADDDEEEEKKKDDKKKK